MRVLDFLGILFVFMDISQRPQRDAGEGSFGGASGGPRLPPHGDQPSLLHRRTVLCRRSPPLISFFCGLRLRSKNWRRQKTTSREVETLEARVVGGATSGGGWGFPTLQKIIQKIIESKISFLVLFKSLLRSFEFPRSLCCFLSTSIKTRN